MNSEYINRLKEIINNNDSIDSKDKASFIESLDALNLYDSDLNKDTRLKELVNDCFEFLKNDGLSREDKLLTDYGLNPNATLDEIKAKRDSLVEELTRAIKTSRYAEKGIRIRNKRNRVIKDFEHIIEHYGKERKNIDADQYFDNMDNNPHVKNVMEYAELVNALSEFAVDTEAQDEVTDVKDQTINYAYEGMSEEQINEAKKDLETHPINTAKYGDNVSEYLEPIEYIENTNIRKPRNRGPFESDEHYNAFLKEYYERYSFGSQEEATFEEANEFFTNKLEYVKTRVQSYFGDVKENLADLRWLYNYSLNETKNLKNDIESYKEKANEDPKYSEYQQKDEEDIKLYHAFTTKYKESLDSVNGITSKLFNEPTLKGDVLFTVQLDKKDGELNATISPLMAISDEETRKRLANYSIDENGVKNAPAEYNLQLDELKLDHLNNMINEFIETAVEGIDGLDVDTIKNSNVEVIVDDKVYIMPVKTFGINICKYYQLGADALKKDTEEEIVKEKAEEITRSDRLIEMHDDVAKELDEALVETPVEGFKSDDRTDDIPYAMRDDADNSLATDTATSTVDTQVNQDIVDGIKAFDERMAKPDAPQPDVNEAIKAFDERMAKPEPTIDLTQTIKEVDERLAKPEPTVDIEEGIKQFDIQHGPTNPGERVVVSEGTPVETPTEPTNNEPEPTLNDYGNDSSYTQEELHAQYEVKPIRKARHTKKSIALAFAGGAMALFGAATLNAPLVVAGSSTLVGDGLLNVKNLYRAAQKHKLKKIAKENNVKVFFTKNHGVTMRNLDGYKLDKDQTEAIQQQLDEKINSKLDPEFVPRVTVLNLEDSFIIDGDKENYYVASRKDEREYKDMLKQEDSMFAKIEPEDDLYVNDEPVQEEQKDVPSYQEHADLLDVDFETEMRAAKAAVEDIESLNPALKGQFQKDNEGYWIQLENPKDVILPEGFTYDNADGFSNFNNTNDIPVRIAVYPILDYNDQVEEAIKTYGNTLKDATDTDLANIATQYGGYTFEVLVAARDRLNQMSL